MELKGLDLKCWGGKSLSNIVSSIGKFVRVDKITQEKSNLLFARVLVEVQTDQEFPEMVQILNEKGIVIDQKVFYAWKPINCTSCNGYGHSHEQCFNPKKQKKVWTVKTNSGKPCPTQSRPIQHDVKEAGTQLSGEEQEHQATVDIPHMNNSFAVLTEASTEELSMKLSNMGGKEMRNEMQELETPEGHG